MKSRTVNGTVACAVILMTGFGVPYYFLRDVRLENVEISVFSVVVPLLYAIFVIACAFLAAGKVGAEVTSKATDEKIAARYAAIRRSLQPLWWVLIGCWVAWMIYSLWKLSQDH